MAESIDNSPAIWRCPKVQSVTGNSRSTLYVRMSEGLFPSPIRIGPRGVGWVSTEVASVIAAQIAGMTDAELRALVSKLERDRKSAAAEVLS